MYNFTGMSYKELQFHAKQWKIPANMQRNVLIEALVAFSENQHALSNKIVEDYKENRKKRSASSQPSSRRKGKPMKSVCKSNDEIVVDSTSRMEVQDLSLANNNVQNNSNDQMNVNRSALMNRYLPTSQFAITPNFPRLCDNRFSDFCNYDSKYNIKAPCPATSTPFHSSFMNFSHIQNPVLYQHAEISTYCNSRGVPASLFRQQSSTFSPATATSREYEGPYFGDTLYQSYNHASSCSSSTSLSPHTSISNSISRPETSHGEIDLSNKGTESTVKFQSHILPDLPQLSIGSTTAASNSTWSYNSLLLCQSERTDELVGPKSSNSSNYFERTEPQHTSNKKSTETNDCTALVEVDSNNSDESLNLPDDFAKLLECDQSNVNTPQDTFVASNDLYTHQNNQNTPLVEYYQTTNMLHTQPIPYSSVIHQSNVCADKKYQNQCESYLHPTATSRDSSAVVPTSSSSSLYDYYSSTQPAPQLPAIYNLFDAVNSNYRSFENNQQCSDSPGQHNECAINLAEMAERNRYTENCYNIPSSSTEDDQNSPYASPNVEHREENVTQDQNKNVNGTEQRSQISTVQQECARVQKMDYGYPPGCSSSNDSVQDTLGMELYLQAVQEKQDKITNVCGEDQQQKCKDEEAVKTSTESASLQKEGDRETHMRQLIYESETLHRAKIICQISSNDPSPKNENVHKILETYLKTDLSEGVKPYAMWLSSIVGTGSQQKALESTSDIDPSGRSSCTYSGKECPTFLRSSLGYELEQQCVFQSVTCPAVKCEWFDSTNKLFNHIFEYHKNEITFRSDFLYVIDRKLERDQPFYTFFQKHKEMIYVLRLHIAEDTCLAVVQYIPDMNRMVVKEKRPTGNMQLLSFPPKEKYKVKSWKGSVQPFSDDEKQDDRIGMVQISIHESEFLVLRLFVN